MVALSSRGWIEVPAGGQWALGNVYWYDKDEFENNDDTVASPHIRQQPGT